MLMNTITRVKQMAHLRQKQISDSSCKTIIIDTLLEAVRPLTQAELSYEITSLFHILVSNERLTQQIQVLSQNGVVLFDEENHIFISPAKQADFIIARLQENNLREEATMLWLDNIRDHQEVTAELEKNLSQALPIFCAAEAALRRGAASTLWRYWPHCTWSARAGPETPCIFPGPM